LAEKDKFKKFQSILRCDKKNNAFLRLALLRYQEKAVANPFENTGAYAADN